MSKSRRDEERAYAAEMAAIEKRHEQDERERDASHRSLAAKKRRTHCDVFQDTYGDPVIHLPEED